MPKLLTKKQTGKKTRLCYPLSALPSIYPIGYPKGIHIGIDPEMKEIEDFLLYIDDHLVQLSVLASYHATVRSHHLVYIYNENLNEFQQTRVRVLTRMIWYCCIPERENTDMAFVVNKSEEVEEKKEVKPEVKETPKADKKPEQSKSEEKKVDEPKAEPKKAESKVKVEEKKIEEKKPEVKKPEEKKPELKISRDQVVYFPNVLLHAYPTDSGFNYCGNVQVDEIIKDVVRVKYVRPGSGVVLGYIALRDFNQDS